MSHVLFDLHLGSARLIPTRLLSTARLLARVWRDSVTSAMGQGPARRDGLVRAGQAPPPAPMVMTAAFGGRTYTRPGSGAPHVRGW
jgi:hypothetical protein